MLQTYDPKKVKAIFRGIPMLGFVDGTFVTVERSEDTFTLRVGSDGETVRTRNHNRSGRITFTLLASSPTNDLLSAAMKADELSGLGVGPFLLNELNGATQCQAGNTWVTKPPTVSFGKESEQREWTLEADAIDIFVGGINLV